MPTIEPTAAANAAAIKANAIFMGKEVAINSHFTGNKEKVFMEEYNDVLKEVFQQRKTYLDTFCMRTTQHSEAVIHTILGMADDPVDVIVEKIGDRTDINSPRDRIQYQDVITYRRSCRTTPRSWKHYFDDIEKFRTNLNMQTGYTQAGIYAMYRKVDKVIIAGFLQKVLGDVHRNQGEEYTLLDMYAFFTNRMSIGLLNRINQRLANANIPMDIKVHVIGDPSIVGNFIDHNRDILKQTYIDGKPIQTGTMPAIMGINFTTLPSNYFPAYTLTLDNSTAPKNFVLIDYDKRNNKVDATNLKINIFYAIIENSMMLATAQGLSTNIGVNPERDFRIEVKYKYDIGTMRMHDDGVIPTFVFDNDPSDTVKANLKKALNGVDGYTFKINVESLGIKEEKLVKKGNMQYYSETSSFKEE